MRTEESLGIFWNGEEVDGLLAYGLWAAGPDPEPVFPAGEWPAGTEWKPWTLRGDSWLIFMWTIRLTEWPAPEQWESALSATLTRLIDAGAAVAWFGLEGRFAEPPSLFDPEEMSESVYAAKTRDGAVFSRAHLGAPFDTLSTPELAELRRAAANLQS